MAIVSSNLAFNELQPNGSRVVIEHHVDNEGVVHEIHYAPGVGVDVNAMLATHAAEVAELLVQREIAEVLNGSG